MAAIKGLIVVACCDNPTERGYFCEMITHKLKMTSTYLKQEYYNFSQCGTHILQIRKLQLTKTWFLKMFIFYFKNAVKLVYEHL